MDSPVLRIPHEARRVLLVANPGASAGPRAQAVRELSAALRDLSLEVEIVGDLATLAALAAQHQLTGQLRAVVAAGGDGTVAEVINRVAPDVPVTVFPLGTANLLAKYLQIPCDPQVAARMIVTGHVRRFDAGNANGRVFLLMVGCGFDAVVVRGMHERRGTARIRYWSYLSHIWTAIRSYKYPLLRIYLGDEMEQPLINPSHATRWAFVFNLPCYAAGLKIGPQALGDDGHLDLITFERGSLWHGLRYVAFTFGGWQRVLSDCAMTEVNKLRIEADEPVPYQLDGDPGGWLPLQIEILPNRVTLLGRWPASAAAATQRTDSIIADGATP